MRLALCVLMLALCIAMLECTAGQVDGSSNADMDAKKEEEITSTEEADDTTTSTEEQKATSGRNTESSTNQGAQGSATGDSESNGIGKGTSSTPQGEGDGLKSTERDVKDPSKPEEEQNDGNHRSTTSSMSQTTSSSSQPSSSPKNAVEQQPERPGHGPSWPPGTSMQLKNAINRSDPTKVAGQLTSNSRDTGIADGKRDTTPSKRPVEVMRQQPSLGGEDQGEQTKASQREVTNVNGSPPSTTTEDKLTTLATVPSTTMRDANKKEKAVQPPGADSNVDSTTAPEIAEDIAYPADPKKTPSAPNLPLPTVSKELPLHHSVDKTDFSLCSSSLFALAALATLAVAAAAPAH